MNENLEIKIGITEISHLGCPKSIRQSVEDCPIRMHQTLGQTFHNIANVRDTHHGWKGYVLDIRVDDFQWQMILRSPSHFFDALYGVGDWNLLSQPEGYTLIRNIPALYTHIRNEPAFTLKK